MRTLKRRCTSPLFCDLLSHLLDAATNWGNTYRLQMSVNVSCCGVERIFPSGSGLQNDDGEYPRGLFM